jgi:hypothetical protein
LHDGERVQRQTDAGANLSMMQSFSRQNHAMAILPNFGRAFGPIITGSSLV